YPPLPFALISDVGPMTRSVRDAALMLTVIADPDARDIWALHNPAPDYRVGLEDGVRGLRIAWSPRLGFVDRIDAEIEQITAQAARVFEELGAKVEQADPQWQDPIGIIRLLWQVGSWTELSGADKQRWHECDPGLVACALQGKDIAATDFIQGANGRTPLYR